MYVVTFCLLLAVFFTWLESTKQLKYGMAFAYVLVSVFFSLRYGYGNDYFGYRDIFRDVSSCSSLSDALYTSYYERGWVILNYFFKNLGFQTLIAFCTVLTVFIYYYVIRQNVPSKYFWVATAIYLFTPTIFLLNLSMIRQGLACSFFLLSVSFLLEKKHLIIALILVFFAVSVHTSAYLCIPFCFLLLFSKHLTGKILVSIELLLVLILILYPQIILPIVEQILQENNHFSKYSQFVADDKDKVVTGMGLILSVISLLPILFNLKYVSRNNQFFIFLYIIRFALVPMGFLILMAMRLSYYFVPFSILVYPLSYIQIRAKTQNVLLMNSTMAILAIIICYTYFSFFKSSTYAWAYTNYETILNNF